MNSQCALSASKYEPHAAFSATSKRPTLNCPRDGRTSCLMNIVIFGHTAGRLFTELFFALQVFSFLEAVEPLDGLICVADYNLNKNPFTNI